MNKHRDIVLLYIQGKSGRERAKMLGKSHEWVYSILRKEPLYHVFKKLHLCARHRNIVRMIFTGFSTRLIAKKVGLSLPRVYAIIKQLAERGCIPKEILESRKGFAPVTNRIVRLVKEGKTIPEIAQRIGWKETSVRVYLSRLVRLGLLDYEDLKLAKMLKKRK